MVSCNKQSAVEYNNTITTEQSAIIKTILEFSQNAQNKNFDAAEKNRLTAVEQTKKSIAVIEKMGDFDGDSKLKTAALDLFKFYEQAFGKDYKELIELAKNGENTTMEQMTRMQEIVTGLTEKESSLDRNFQTVQKDFAAKHKIEIQKNKLQDDIDKLKE